MSLEQTLLDSINILVENAVAQTTKIYDGVVQSVVKDGRVNMTINGKTNSVQYYGAAPTVGKVYRVFVPNNIMSQAFIINGDPLPKYTSDDAGKVLTVKADGSLAWEKTS